MFNDINYVILYAYLIITSGYSLSIALLWTLTLSAYTHFRAIPEAKLHTELFFSIFSPHDLPTFHGS